MRVLCGTLAGNGFVHVPYFLSALQAAGQASQNKQLVANEIIKQIPNFNIENPAHERDLRANLHHHSVDLGFYLLQQESLISRGRNHVAYHCLLNGYDKILFIDSDQGFTFDNILALVKSPHPIIAGLVPLKAYFDYPNSFKTSLNFLPFQEDEKYFTGAVRDLAGTVAMAKGHGSNLIKVAFTGTGFLCIDKSVLMKLAETTDEYLYPDPATRESSTHWSFFDGGPIDGKYLSEDWQFINKCREIGYDIYVDTNVRLTHVGQHTYHCM